MKVTLCIPTLNRYDLLDRVIQSAEAGIVKPDFYHIIDNGTKLGLDFASYISNKIKITRPYKNLGVAASWNLFIHDNNDIRIVCNDDVIFYEDTVKRLVDGFDENNVTYPLGIPSTNSFSCYTLPNKVVKDVGLFDEKISPGYAYYEDNDYHRRMLSLGHDIVGIKDCKLWHDNSSTMKNYSKEELENHHTRFKRATYNYKMKWGGLPGNESLVVPRDLV
jgi:GT2 family glycosyltransferase